jgi:hypothetical protein
LCLTTFLDGPLDISDPLPITDFFPFCTSSHPHPQTTVLALLDFNSYMAPWPGGGNTANMRLECKRGSETYECETQNPDPAVTSCNIHQAFPAIDEDYSRLASDSNPLYPLPLGHARHA